ncbi:hypothetical protein G6F40_015142 [Rhizopus arrhizus]|nr:hypothetical protein G6F40_015142 [Rhizopus arrhizus]
MQFRTISPAPRCCASTIQSRVRTGTAWVLPGSPLKRRTRHCPSASRTESTPTTTLCTPNSSANSVISCGRPNAGELIDTLSAPANSTRRAVSTLSMPPATQNGMSIRRAMRSIQATATERASGLAPMS